MLCALCPRQAEERGAKAAASNNNKEKELPGSSAAEPKLLDSWQRCMQVTREGKVESTQQAATKFAVWMHWMEVVVLATKNLSLCESIKNPLVVNA